MAKNKKNKENRKKSRSTFSRNRSWAAKSVKKEAGDITRKPKIWPRSTTKPSTPGFKRNLMSEFSALWHQPGKNMSSMRQTSEETIEVMLRHYPANIEIPMDVEIFHEFIRLRHFGWQLRSLKYDKDMYLHLNFEKVDWRSVGYYGLMPTKHNANQNLWWLKDGPQKKFTLKGPNSTREIILGPDEMIEWNIIKTADYQARNPEGTFADSVALKK